LWIFFIFYVVIEVWAKNDVQGQSDLKHERSNEVVSQFQFFTLSNAPAIFN